MCNKPDLVWVIKKEDGYTYLYIYVCMYFISLIIKSKSHVYILTIVSKDNMFGQQYSTVLPKITINEQLIIYTQVKYQWNFSLSYCIYSLLK